MGFVIQLPGGLAATGAALLGLAGAVKLVRPGVAANALAAARRPGVVGLVRLVGLMELLVGVAWLAWPSTPTGLALAGLYLALLGVGTLLAVRKGSAPPCGCFGSNESRFTVTHASFNVIMVVAATIAAVGGPPESVWHEGVVTVALYAVGLATATYLGYLLLIEFDAVARAPSRASTAAHKA